MLKILQARLQQYMNRELPDVQAGFRKPDIKLSTSSRSSKKQESSRKTSISALLTMPKPLTVWIITNCGKFWKRWEYQTTCLLRNLYAGQEATVRLDMKQQTRSKSGKEYVKAVYCHPAYLTSMQSNAGLDEAQAGIKIAGRNINHPRYADDTTLMAESEEELKSLLMKVKEKSE